MAVGGEGTVRGAFDLDVSPAVRGVREYRREAARADAQTRQLGSSISDAFGANQVASIEAVRSSIRGVAEDTRQMRVDSNAQWKGMRREIQRESAAIVSTIAVVRDRLRELGRLNPTPTVDLRGVTAALAQITALKKALRGLQGVQPTIALGGGFTSPAGGGRSGSGRGRGGGLIAPGGIGFSGVRGRTLLAGSAIALPIAQALTGAGVATIGSAGAGALGAGAAGLGGLAPLLAGVGGIVAVAKPAGESLKEVFKAQDAFTKAVRQHGRDSKQAAAAEKELTRARRLAGPGAGYAAAQRRGFGEDWRRLSAPARRQYFGLQGDVAQIGRRAAPQLAENSLVSTRALRQVGTRQARFLAGTRAQDDLAFLTRTFARELPTAERTLENVERTFLNLSRTAVPFFHEANVWTRNWTAGWRSSTTDIGATRNKMEPLVESAKKWADLTGSTFHLLTAIGGASRPAGDSLVVSLTRTFDRWEDWIDRNPGRVDLFFRTAVSDTERMARGVGDIVRGLSAMASELRPLIAPLSTLASLVGNISGALSPGAAALAFSGVRRATSRTSRGVLLGGRGGAAGAGGARGGAGGAGGVRPAAAGPTAAGGLFPFLLGTRAAVGPGGQTRRQRITSAYGGAAYGARQAGAGRVAAARAGAGGARTAIQRTGGYGTLGRQAAGRTARSTARFALPVLAIGGLSGAFGGEGANQGDGVVGTAAHGVRNAFQGVGAMFGLANPVLGTDERVNRGMSRGSQFVSGLSGGSAPTTRQAASAMRELRPELSRAERAYANEVFEGNRNNAKEALAYLKTLRGQATAYKDIAKAARDARDSESKRRAMQYGSQLPEAFATYRNAGQSREKAGLSTAGQIEDRLKHTKNAGVETLGEASLQWARALAKRYPEMRSTVDKLTDSIEARFKRMGRRVQIVNGNILTGSKSEWGQIAAALSGASETARQKVTADFTAIQNQAIGSLRAMGFGPNEAKGIVSGLEKGGNAAKAAGYAKTQGPGSMQSRIVAGSAAGPPSIPKKARGGMIGGAGLTDTVPTPDGGLAAPGEAWIANRHSLDKLSRATRAAYGMTAQQIIRGETRRHSMPMQNPLDHARGGLLRYATGGVIGAAAGAIAGGTGGKANGRALPNVLGSKPGFAVFMQAFQQMFGSDLYVMSGNRPGSRVAGTGRVSNHASGDAIDISNPRSAGGTPSRPPPQTGLDKLYPYIRTNIPQPPRRDLLWRTTTGGNHFNHVHFGADPSVTGSIAAARKYVGGLPGADSIGALGDGTVGAGGAGQIKVRGVGIKQAGIPGILRGRAGDIYAAGLQKGINAELAKKTAPGGGDLTGFSGGGAAAANMDLGRRMMLAAGFGPDQWPALKTLWQGESGWNNMARNPSSGAFGIPQALPPGKMGAAAVSGDAAAQIAWGLGYIRDRYKSPAGALAAWQGRSPHWYARGGRMQGGNIGGLGGGMAWAGAFDRTGSFVTNGPTAFVAGEGPRNRKERVTVTPAASSGHGGLVVNVEAGAVVVQAGGDLQGIDANAIGEKIVREIIAAIDRGKAAGVIG